MVSVILPNYNHASFLKERIESILAQSYQDFELIILDDCSPDNSRAVIETFRNHPKVSQIIYNEQNSGSTFHQWSKGIALARGSLIWVAESDDVAHPELLQTLLPAFRDSQVVFSYCQSYSIDATGQQGRTWLSHTNPIDPGRLFECAFTLPGTEFLEKFLLHRNVVPNASACVFRKEAYLKTGGAIPKFKVVGDWYVWIRLALEGSIAFHPEALNGFRKHGTSVIARASAQIAQKPILLYDYEMRKHLQKIFNNRTEQTLRHINKIIMLKEHDAIGWHYYQNKAITKALPYYIRRFFRKVFNNH